MDWNFRNDQPIYSQLIQRLTEAIVSGVYAPGEKLPSVRELAVSLAINPNTIQRAYHELESEGYIVSVPGKGSFCAQFSPQSDPRREESSSAASSGRTGAAGASCGCFLSVMARPLPALFSMSPISCKCLMWKWTVEGDLSPSASPISRTEGA